MTTTSTYLASLKKDIETGPRGFPGPSGATGGESMVFPGAGIALSTGSAWGTSIATDYYAPLASPVFTGSVGIGKTPSDSMTLDVDGHVRIDSGNGLYLRNGYTAVIKNPTNNTRTIQFDQDSTGTFVFTGDGELRAKGDIIAAYE